MYFLGSEDHAKKLAVAALCTCQGLWGSDRAAVSPALTQDLDFVPYLWQDLCFVSLNDARWKKRRTKCRLDYRINEMKLSGIGNIIKSILASKLWNQHGS